jgi:RimJ/RimL family protein N-acetyltransferase
MDSFLDNIKNGWKSERLVYRAMDIDKPEITIWMQKHMVNDPVINAFAAGNIFKPRTSKEGAQMMEFLPKSLLSVAICLRRDNEDDGDEDEYEMVESLAENHSASSQQHQQKQKQQQQQKYTMIGFTGLQGNTLGGANHLSAEMGICLAEAYRGQGYGGEAMKWVAGWGFRFAGLHRISLGVFSFNEHAIALYKSLGYVEEGRAREAYFFDRKWYDIIAMGLLEREWEAMQDEETLAKFSY